MSVEVVAEIGSNWNGNYQTAEMIIAEAAICGADTVKFQHYPDERYGPHVLSRDDLIDFSDKAVSHGMRFLCSVFNLRTLRDYVDAVTPTRVKIASPELTDHDLLRACGESGLEVILSTGMSTKDQVFEALNVLYDVDATVTLLHCTSSYPAPPDEMNLKAMKTLSSIASFGLSDHSLDPTIAPVVATALGASMIEKHFTLNRFDQGPDHGYSLDPPYFAAMVAHIRCAEQMLGDGDKRVMPSEDPTDRRTEEWVK